MRTLKLAFLTTLGLAFAASSSFAGTITSTIGGLSNTSVVAGAIVVVDSTVTFGPTTVGGVGAGFEFSFDYAGGTPTAISANTVPTGWFPLPQSGLGACVAGHCENISAAGDLFGSGQQFVNGATFQISSVTIDTTGLAPGVYSVGAGLTGPGDDILTAGPLSVGGEYSSVAATITIVPEPGTAALMGLGLLALAAAGRRRN